MTMQAKSASPKRKSRSSRTNEHPPIAPQLWHPDVPGPLWNGTRLVRRDQIETYCRVLAREFRPQKISITEISKLLANPYTIYAKKILRLEPLDKIEHRLIL